ncbi:hypothetical protein VTK73DRAFT_8686 [Phialemonium thermophilum]|uniref:Zn(2)-C6 fungal-type domain-containing protein n=1 Tax=Phialemonium thermophilum TaxID=223376 RepID=A0ABR3W725_9PEZI
MDISGSERPGAGKTARTSPHPNKACVPCRARKVKCDAAAIGLPCSSCTSRHCAKDCVLPVRKRRTGKTIRVFPASSHDAGSPRTVGSSQSSHLYQTNPSRPSEQAEQHSPSHAPDCLSPRPTDSGLLYLNILHDAVKERTESSGRQSPSVESYRTRPEDRSFGPDGSWTSLPRLDDIDREYLVRKGVFDLPPQPHRDILVKAYFDHVHPFASVISRADFVRRYQSGSCSLFLLHVILALASLHAPAASLSACGLASRSAAQESFFAKAKLLHDFSIEEEPLVVLQGSIILSMVILDHPSDWDYGFWFHNAIRLATKLDIRNTCIRGDKPREALKLYRRIWWALYFLDVFYVLVNTRRSRLLQDTSAIGPRTEDDLDEDDAAGVSSALLSAPTPQQRASPVVHCELSRIVGQCLSAVTNKPQQDPRKIMQPLDAWRKHLAAKMHVVDECTRTDVYYLNIQAMSYRFECILCRLVRRRGHQSPHVDWSEWAKRRLRSAVLELDTITMRVLANGTLHDFPVSFVTTVIALLALHIESALDPAETDLVRSMARISINQTMLVLAQGKEIPAVKRALPVLEDILAKKNLYLVPPPVPSQVAVQSPQPDGMTGRLSSPQTQTGAVPSQPQQMEDDPSSLYGDFLGFEFLDEWQVGQLNFTDGC